MAVTLKDKIIKTLIDTQGLTKENIDEAMLLLQCALLERRADPMSVWCDGVKRAALSEAVEAERPVRYLQSASTSKEDLARRLLEEHPVERGLVCAFTAVEPCMSFEYHRSKDHDERGLRLRPRKCLHVYKYWRHPSSAS